MLLLLIPLILIVRILSLIATWVSIEESRMLRVDTF
jgi:hypothetical protein